MGFNDVGVSCFPLVGSQSAAGLSVCSVAVRLERHGGFQWHFQLFRAFCQGVFELHVIVIDVTNASQSSVFDQTTGHERRGPGCCLNFCQPLSGPRASFWRLSVQH